MNEKTRVGPSVVQNGEDGSVETSGPPVEVENKSLLWCLGLSEGPVETEDNLTRT